MDASSERRDIKYSIVLPVYNQADHIAGVVADYRTSLADFPLSYELILVTNACRDDSPRICRQLAESSPEVRAIDSIAGGWGLAVRLGLSQCRGDWIGYTNSARTTGAQLLKILKQSVDSVPCVIKARRKNRSLVRGVGSALYNIECRMLFGLSWADVNGTPKIFPRSFAPLLHLTRDDDLLDAEFSWVCRRNRYPVVEVPIEASSRHGGESTTKMKSAMRLYSGAFKLWREGSSSDHARAEGANIL